MVYLLPEVPSPVEIFRDLSPQLGHDPGRTGGRLLVHRQLALRLPVGRGVLFQSPLGVDEDTVLLQVVRSARRDSLGQRLERVHGPDSHTVSE